MIWIQNIPINFLSFSVMEDGIGSEVNSKVDAKKAEVTESPDTGNRKLSHADSENIPPEDNKVSPEHLENEEPSTIFLSKNA